MMMAEHIPDLWDRVFVIHCILILSILSPRSFVHENVLPRSDDEKARRPETAILSINRHVTISASARPFEPDNAMGRRAMPLAHVPNAM